MLRSLRSPGRREAAGPFSTLGTISSLVKDEDVLMVQAGRRGPCTGCWWPRGELPEEGQERLVDQFGNVFLRWLARLQQRALNDERVNYFQDHGCEALRGYFAVCGRVLQQFGQRVESRFENLRLEPG